MNPTVSEVQQLLRQAGIEIPAARAEALILALQGMAVAVRTLAVVDYGAAEPAARFRAPTPEAK